MFLKLKKGVCTCYIMLFIAFRVIVSELFTMSLRNYLIQMEPEMQVTSDSTIHCALLCSMNPICLTYAFNKETLLCNIQYTFTKDWSRLKGKNEDGWTIYASTKPVCEDGWITMENTCYLFNETEMNWKDAQDSCVSYHSYLVEIDSEREDQFIENHIFNGRTGNAYVTATYWLGGVYRKDEGKWIWDHSNRTIPVQGGGVFSKLDVLPHVDGRDCLYYMHMLLNIGSSWNQLDCNTNYQFVCEKLL